MSEPWRLHFTPAARAVFARRFGVSPAAADALLEANTAEIQALWERWRQEHPDGSEVDFLHWAKAETEREMAAVLGLSPETVRATLERVVARARARSTARRRRWRGRSWS
jgi:hypothetical protein